MIHFAIITLKSGKRVKRKIKDGEVKLSATEIDEIQRIELPKNTIVTLPYALFRANNPDIQVWHI